MKKAIILGNGPSLNDMPQELIFTMDSFGANYCKYFPMYYICVDTDILLNHWKDIRGYVSSAKIAFLSLKHERSSKLYDLPNVQMVTHDKGAFAGEVYFTGLTATYVALKMAYYMGYDEVHLYGVDHDANWSHYRDGYPIADVAGIGWRRDGMKWHYQHAANVYKAAGRRIINHSYPSELDQIFERGKEIKHGISNPR